MTEILIAALTGILTGLVGLAAYYAATRQNRLTVATVAADWLRDLRSWGSEAVDVLSEASYICRRDDTDPSPDEGARLHCCRYRLSALIDRGRFLLPNERENEYGGHKPAAYQGLRHPALDALVAAERVLGNDAPLGSFPDRKSALIELRREFVSMIQAILGPRSVNKKVAAILREAHDDRKKDPTLGGLLPNPDSVPTGAEGLLYTASRRYEQRTSSQLRQQTSGGRSASSKGK
jgi:hypothetical protein